MKSYFPEMVINLYVRSLNSKILETYHIKANVRTMTTDVRVFYILADNEL